MAEVLGVDVRRLRGMPTDLRITDRRDAATWLSVSDDVASRMLTEVARLVADLPRDAAPRVVWTTGAAELLVHTDEVTVTAGPGTLLVTMPIDCDQLDAPAEVAVLFAVGTPADPRGLFLATHERPHGPEVVVAVWADALIAFAWETLLTLAARLAAASGVDGEGRVLVPRALAAGRGSVQVMPMPRDGAR